MKPIMFYDRLAMCSPPEETGWTLLGKIDDATRYVVAYQNGHSVAVGFYETKGQPTIPLVDDWKQNFELEKKFFLLKESGLSIVGPRGFIEEYISVREQIFDWIIRARPTEVYIAGRSQGGTHALYLYADLVDLLPAVKTTAVSLASVACTDSRSRSIISWKAKGTSSSFNRVNLSGDLITFIPMWLLGYSAYGKLKVIGEFWKRFWPFDTTRHYNESYVPYLEKSGLEF